MTFLPDNYSLKLMVRLFLAERPQLSLSVRLTYKQKNRRI